MNDSASTDDRLDGDVPLRSVAREFERIFGPNHPETLVSLDSLAAYYFSKEKFDDAGEEVSRLVFDRSWESLGRDHPATLERLLSHVMFLSMRDKYEEAELLLREGTAIAKQAGSLSPDDLKVWRVTLELIVMMRDLASPK